MTALYELAVPSTPQIGLHQHRLEADAFFLDAAGQVGIDAGAPAHFADAQFGQRSYFRDRPMVQPARFQTFCKSSIFRVPEKVLAETSDCAPHCEQTIR